MPYASALTTTANSRQALEEVCTRCQASLDGPPDLALLFFSPHHAAADLAAAHHHLQPRCLLGCPGEAIVGDDREIENGPALALWLARWPQTATLTPFHLTLEQTSEGPNLLGWPDVLTGIDPREAFVLLLADPFTFPIDAFLCAMNEEHAGVRVMGGMASGGREPGQNQRVFGSSCIEQGAVGVVVQGVAGVRSVVSQECRPIGRNMVVTKAEDNIIFELGGRPPRVLPQELWPKLNPR